MGTSTMIGGASRYVAAAPVSKFYSSSAWIEGRAEEQLTQVARRPGVTKVAAFPDLHPGKYGPVGCAVLADRVYPQLVGGDIGCGMSLFALDIPLRKFKIEKAARRLRALEGPSDVDASTRLEAEGLPGDLADEALGTIGGGNHFCEVQSLADTDLADFDRGLTYLLVHSGSRSLGVSVVNALREGAFEGLQGEEADAYREAHDRAARWARLNRLVIAERAAMALRADLAPLIDAPHNLLEKTDAGWLHRKGAAVALPLVPLAGSRATASFLLRPMGNSDALGSLSHGAGRRYDRSSMHGRVQAKRSDIEAMERTPFGGRVICEDRALLVEEAPLAYKSAESVVADLQAAGVAEPVATFHPLITFKKAGRGGRT